MIEKKSSFTTGMALIIIIYLMSGCNKTDSGNLTALPEIIADFKIILAATDEKLGFYEDALTSIGAYLDNPTDESLTEAINKCEASVKYLLESKPVLSSLNENIKNELPKLGIDMIDYNEMFNIQQIYTDDYLQGLASLMFYLDKPDDLHKQLEQNYICRNIINQAERKLLYIGINHLFSDVTGDELDDFRLNFLPELKYLSADMLPWETDKEILEAKAERCLLDIEKAIDDFSVSIGNDYTEVMEMEQIFKEALSELGYSADEIKEILKDIYSQSKDPNIYFQDLLEIIGQ